MSSIRSRYRQSTYGTSLVQSLFLWELWFIRWTQLGEVRQTGLGRFERDGGKRSATKYMLLSKHPRLLTHHHSRTPPWNGLSFYARWMGTPWSQNLKLELETHRPGHGKVYLLHDNARPHVAKSTRKNYWTLAGKYYLIHHTHLTWHQQIIICFNRLETI